jgi:hypothetical protein
MGAFWMVICSGSVAAGSVLVLLEVSDGTLDALVGVVLVVALAVLARGAIRFASDPAGARGEDEQP